jgi:membrane-associated phospholipid phosphatase
MQNEENIQNESLRGEFAPSSSYERVIYGIYRMPTVAEMLRVLSHVIGALAIYAYCWLLLMTLNDKGVTELLRVILVTGAPFLVVSVLREWISAPRPYDIYPFFEKKPKNKKGRSFPSRHVFSIVLIGFIYTTLSVWIGVGIIVSALILAVLRVLLGIHFIRDVVAGAVMGAIAGAIGLLVLYLV